MDASLVLDFGNYEISQSLTSLIDRLACQRARVFLTACDIYFKPVAAPIRTPLLWPG